MDGGSTSPKQVQLFVNNVPITGRSAGQYINMVFNREQYTEVVGVDGEGYFVVVPDMSGRLTVSLGQQSASNDYLTRLFLAQTVAPGNVAWPVRLVEKNGTTSFTAARGVIVKLPDVAFSDSGEVRVWTIASTLWVPFVGGLPVTPQGQVTGGA